MRARPVRLIAILASLVLAAALPISAQATHAWGSYHWARTANPFTVTVIDSMTSDWDGNLDAAVADWDSSSVMNVAKAPGDSSTKTRKRCPAVTGKVRACNSTYGNNGWLGLAQIWIQGSHIIKGTAKMNDTYLASSGYSEVNRQHVICQEIGHVWGLDHQDVSGADLNTCMDYSSALDNPSPNAHDYAQLETIYAHLDSTSTVASASAASAKADARADASWGMKVFESSNGRAALFVRDLGRGLKVFTHVLWTR